MGGVKISKEERGRITNLIREGKTVKEVSKITGRAKATVARIRDEDPEYIKMQESQPNSWTKQWLEKNWHWEIPQKKTDRRKRSQYFRTPYNC